MTFAELYGIDEVPAIRHSIPAVLAIFEDVFYWPEELPSQRSIEHHIHLKKGTDPVKCSTLQICVTKGGDGEVG